MLRCISQPIELAVKRLLLLLANAYKNHHFRLTHRGVNLSVHTAHAMAKVQLIVRRENPMASSETGM